MTGECAPLQSGRERNCSPQEEHKVGRLIETLLAGADMGIGQWERPRNRQQVGKDFWFHVRCNGNMLEHLGLSRV